MVGRDGRARARSSRTRFAKMDDLAFLDGAGALLRSFPNLRSALFAALCVMAQVRPSAYVDLRWDELDAALAEKRERELFRVVGTLQDRFGRLAFDRVEGDAGASGLLLWSTEHPALRDELPPPLSPPPPQPTWRTAERPDGALVQRIFDAGALCDADEPTQTIRFLLTLSPPPPTDGGDAPPPPPPPQIVHEEDCDDTLTRPLLLEELARYRDVALKLDADVHVEIEYDTQEGDFEQGDTTERHITNTVVLRMDARARAPPAATDGEAEAEAAPADPGKEEL